VEHAPAIDLADRHLFPWFKGAQGTNLHKGEIIGQFIRLTIIGFIIQFVGMASFMSIAQTGD
jgi:hypothetical protein